MAPAVALYRQLLPGITNATQRARAYSFYPWLLWAIEAGGLPRDPASLVTWLRRAECLWCLIGFCHGAESGDESHGVGLTGRDRLGEAWEQIAAGRRVRLSTYAALEEGPTRYFKPRLGGLGQYYLSTLTDLRIASGDASAGLVYDKARGVALARAMDAAVDRSLFLETLRADVVSTSTLKALERYCPCYLTKSRAERNLLHDLFFNRPGVFFAESDAARPLTLGLLLNLAGYTGTKNNKDGLNLSTWEFRACAYSGTLGSGRPWQLPPQLEEHRRLWAIYQRSELLSLAVQGIFWAAMRVLARAPYPLASGTAAGEWVQQELGASALGRTARNVPALVDGVRLPPLGDWSHKAHEMELASVVTEAEAGEEEEGKATLTASLRLLLALCARPGGGDDPYAGFALEPDYFQQYPINLRSLADHKAGTWRSLSGAQWIAWLVTHWGIENHFHVALRKLRYESRDTFRVWPGEHGLEVGEAVGPASTNPRIGRARQMLLDLGLLDRDADGYVLATAAGAKTMREMWP